MAGKRLRKVDRRASILDAATKVFAEFGRDGAKTLMIANEAQISEALIFRHFPSKDALYSAVLRKMIGDQDEAFAAVGVMSPDSAGLVRMMKTYFAAAIRGEARPSADSIRLLFASLAGDGNYARLAYRRAIKLSLPDLQLALQGARDAGDLAGEPIDAVNVVAFLEHIGSTLCVARIGDKPVVQYAGGDNQLLREMVLFCGRGIGLREETIKTQLTALEAEAEAAAKVPAPRKRAKPSPRRPSRIRARSSKSG